MTTVVIPLALPCRRLCVSVASVVHVVLLFLAQSLSAIGSAPVSTVTTTNTPVLL